MMDKLDECENLCLESKYYFKLWLDQVKSKDSEQVIGDALKSPHPFPVKVRNAMIYYQYDLICKHLFSDKS